MSILEVLVGLFVGAGLTQFADVRGRRATLRRDLLDRRVNAYAEFLTAAFLATSQMASLWRLKDTLDGLDTVRDAAQVARVEQAITDTTAGVRAANERSNYAAQVIAILAPQETYNVVIAAVESITQSIAEGAKVHGPGYDEALALIKADVKKFTGE
jgi:hypothetical protein